MSEINETEIYNAFEVEPIAEETAETNDSVEETTETTEETTEMSAEERHKNAARRRENEKQKAIDEALAKQKTELEAEYNAKIKKREEEIFSTAKVKNTYTGTEIKSKEDLDAWKKQYDDEKIKRELADGTLSKETIEAIALSVVKGEAQKQSQADYDKKVVDEDIAKVHAIDPSINSISDLIASHNGKKIAELVSKNNMSFSDAYKFANMDTLIASANNGAIEYQGQNERNKEHLKSNAQGHGVGAKSVPRDERAYFELFNPSATEADIEKYYNKNKK